MVHVWGADDDGMEASFEHFAGAVKVFWEIVQQPKLDHLLLAYLGLERV